jgi:drug/metabolite transporter (DMT)-like permease
MLEPIYFIGNILFWSLMPLLEKGAIRRSSHIDMSLLRYILAGAITFLIYIFYKDVGSLFKYDGFIYGRMISVAVLGFFGVFLNYYLLSIYDANFVFSIVAPMSLISMMILSACFFDEQISFKRAVGILVVALGMYIVYSTKDE